MLAPIRRSPLQVSAADLWVADTDMGWRNGLASLHRAFTRIARQRRSEPVILFYSPPYTSPAVALRGCPESCRVVDDLRLLPGADAVVFHIPTLHRDPLPEKRRNQIWVAASAESDVNYPRLADPAFISQFDYTMTYRRDADFWTPYFEPGILPALRTPTQPKDGDAAAVFLASSTVDRSGRTEYVRELMEHMTVASYGRVLRNRALPLDEGRATKLKVIARYPFTLAFENSVTRDYVTEKFFDPLIAGSVPIYLGAPNVEDFAPGDRSYIDVTNFASPRDLAGFLNELAEAPERYAEYLAWKQRPLRRGFVEMVERQRTSGLCRLCMVLRERNAILTREQAAG